MFPISCRSKRANAPRLRLLKFKRDCAVSSVGFPCLLGWPTNPRLLLSRFVSGGMQFIQEMPIFKHPANVLDQRAATSYLSRKNVVQTEDSIA